MDDLSLPFRRATAKVVKVVSAASAVSSAASSASSAASSAASSVTSAGAKSPSTMIILVLIVVGVVAYFYFTSQDTAKQNVTVAMPAAPVSEIKPLPPIVLAKQAKEKCIKTSNQMEKCDLHHVTIQHFLEALAEASAKGPNGNVEAGEICMELAGLFHQGIPETYTQDERLPGVPPDAEQAITFYREAIKFGYHGAVLPLASVYHWGLAGFEGNREVAMHLYGAVLKTGNDHEKGIAKDRLRQMREEEGKSLGTGMLDDEGPLSTAFSSGLSGNSPYEEHFMDIGKSKFDIGHDETTRGMNENYVDDLIKNKLHLSATKRVDDNKRKRRGGEQQKKTQTAVSSDPQNARDHVVVNSAKQSMERLRASTHMQYDVPTTFKMINEYITTKSDASEIKRENAAHVLKEMAKGIANLGYEQSKEIEALHLVWNRIHSQTYAQDRDKRKQLIDNLVSELSECIEFGELVCPTGRFNRIIDALNYLDPIVQIQPQWAIKQMMVAKAGEIEKVLLAKSRGEVRDAMNAQNPNARERQLQQEFSTKLRGAIERDFTRDYVDTGLMTKELLKTELDSWSL